MYMMYKVQCSQYSYIKNECIEPCRARVYKLKWLHCLKTEEEAIVRW